jgi:hypothetical protein
MARNTQSSSVSQIANGASLPSGGGNVVIHRQGFTSNDWYGSETFSDGLAPEPHDEQLL